MHVLKRESIDTGKRQTRSINQSLLRSPDDNQGTKDDMR